jgi:hypothetical protein
MATLVMNSGRVWGGGGRGEGGNLAVLEDRSVSIQVQAGMCIHILILFIA